MAKSNKLIYSFGNGKAEGRGDQKQLLGGKGAGLAEMTHIGLPVPAGFTITTEACEEYTRRAKRWPDGLRKQLDAAVRKLQRTCNKKLGNPVDPLLVSVRSGAASSMPGMMETILNLGLNDRSVEGLATASGDRRFAFDAYRRLIMMYGATARGIDKDRFEEAFDRIKSERTAARLDRSPSETIADTDVNAEELTELVGVFKSIYYDATGDAFPQDPMEQLQGAIDAVFDSWMAPKAVTYRRVEKITGLAGTAVNVCQMVFGNVGERSGTGVCFTRDPSTGENAFYGEFLMNAQGEDVVSGARTPIKLDDMSDLMPDIWSQLLAVRAILELHYGDMQDVEFTVQRGKLYILQTRTGKRSASAAFKIAVEQATLPLMGDDEIRAMTKSKLISRSYAKQAAKPVLTRAQAVRRIKPQNVERLFTFVIDPDVSPGELEHRRLAHGINAVPGAASGAIVFDPETAELRAGEGQEVILVRRETSPEDVGGMYAAQGILTATGGKTSHAAVVARGWGKCCIVGCGELNISERDHSVKVNGRVLHEGDEVTLDGSSGNVYHGRLPLTRPQAPAEFKTLMEWADGFRRLRVRANADTPADASKAIELGAEGIGLCRTEHMFFETDERRLAIQEMIVADSGERRRSALDKLQPFQKQDFLEIFRAMDGKPVTIRLIDPPLHEFLPQNEEGVRRLAAATGIGSDTITYRISQLHEANPMLGHRGCRLCITYPEILEMQVSAIMEAAVEGTHQGLTVLPEIMIPLTIDPKELQILVEQVRAVADAILDNDGVNCEYSVGTMVETPRAALLADHIAKVSRFISFGTNDLTQTAMGLSRDDAGRFLPEYVDPTKLGIFPHDPFESLDIEGVGMLVQWAVWRARETNPNFKLGICGEHGGEADSIRFFHRVGLDYVSCSPLRVPNARLAAALAALEEADEKPARRRAPRSTTARKKAKRTPARRASKTKGAKKTKRTRKRKSASKKKRPASRKSRTAARPKTTARGTRNRATRTGKKRKVTKR